MGRGHRGACRLTAHLQGGEEEGGGGGLRAGMDIAHHSGARRLTAHLQGGRREGGGRGEGGGGRFSMGTGTERTCIRGWSGGEGGGGQRVAVEGGEGRGERAAAGMCRAGTGTGQNSPRRGDSAYLQKWWCGGETKNAQGTTLGSRGLLCESTFRS